MCNKPYFFTRDGKCEQCGKPTYSRELKINWEKMGMKVCNKCVPSEPFTSYHDYLEKELEDF